MLCNLLLFFFQKQCASKGEDRCQYKNAYLNRNGKCVCKRGYFSDGVIDSRGCWKCIPFCVENAICNYNGTCTCKNGYLGEGTEYCTLIEDYPVIIDCVPSSSPRNSQEIIKITLQSEVSPEIIDGYMKIGKYMEMCKVSNNIMTCKLPESKKSKKYPLSVSLNGREWSLNPYEFEFTEKIAKPKDYAFLIYAIIAICLLSFYVLYRLMKFHEDYTLPKKMN